MTSAEYVYLWPADADDTSCGFPKTHVKEETLANISPVLTYTNPSSSNQSDIPAPPPIPNYTASLNKNYIEKASSSDIICRETRDTWDKFFKEGLGADVYIITENNTNIPAHSSYLRHASAAMERCLQQSKPKNGKMHLKLHGVPHAAVYAFIRFLYSSRYEEEDMKNYGLHLLVLSHAFSISQLKRVCVQFLEQEWLTTENVIDVLQLARKCDAPRLSLKCVCKIVRDFKTVSSTEGWKVMKRANPSLEQELLESAVESDSKRKEWKLKAEKKVYVQLHEAMEALVHICKDGCRTIGPRDKMLKDSQMRCNYSACKSIEMLVRHFSGCDRRIPSGCVHCKRFWQFLELHSRMCNDPDSCRVPLCRQLKVKPKPKHPNKKDEAKWSLLVTKVIEAKSLKNSFLSRQRSSLVDLYIDDTSCL